MNKDISLFSIIVFSFFSDLFLKKMLVLNVIALGDVLYKSEWFTLPYFFLREACLSKILLEVVKKLLKGIYHCWKDLEVTIP